MSRDGMWKIGELVRELSEEEFAALRHSRDEAWKALSRQEQERLTEQRRRTVPRAAGGGTQGRP